MRPMAAGSDGSDVLGVSRHRYVRKRRPLSGVVVDPVCPSCQPLTKASPASNSYNQGVSAAYDDSNMGVSRISSLVGRYRCPNPSGHVEYDG